jgi:phage baseplate assembly protein W
MNSVFVDAVDSAVAGFVSETAPRAASEDAYGLDISAVEDLDPMAREVEGEDALAEAIARRLTTPRGSLGDDDPDYGLDVADFLHRAMTAAEIASIPGLVRGELLKDERIADVNARMLVFEQGTRLELELDGVTAQGPFRFTFAATPSSVKLLVDGES